VGEAKGHGSSICGLYRESGAAGAEVWDVVIAAVMAVMAVAMAGRGTFHPRRGCT
jgi:hypothetical protein